jgi:hypothetical protein
MQKYYIFVEVLGSLERMSILLGQLPERSKLRSLNLIIQK